MHSVSGVTHDSVCGLIRILGFCVCGGFLYFTMGVSIMDIRQRWREAGIQSLNRIAQTNAARDWDESKPHFKGYTSPPLVHDRIWALFGLPVLDFWPGKPKPYGWAILWHKWNKGITLSYRLPEPRKEYITWTVPDEDDPDRLNVFGGWVAAPLTFWERWLPRGFTFSIARLGGRWRINRSQCPFMDASLSSAPLLSKDEWDNLGRDNIKIYEKGEPIG